MFDMDAIEASAFKGKVKILFLFIKLKVITIDELKKKSDALKASKGIEIFNPKLIAEIQKFMKTY
jgi:hypothetical protein